MIRMLLSFALMALQFFTAARQPADGENADANAAEATGADNPGHEVTGVDGAPATAGEREERR